MDRGTLLWGSSTKHWDLGQSDLLCMEARGCFLRLTYLAAGRYRRYGVLPKRPVFRASLLYGNGSAPSFVANDELFCMCGSFAGYN